MPGHMQVVKYMMNNSYSWITALRIVLWPKKKEPGGKHQHQQKNNASQYDLFCCKTHAMKGEFQWFFLVSLDMCFFSYSNWVSDIIVLI